MEGEMMHFSHEHPLILKPEEPKKIDDGTHQSVEIIECYMCAAPISGPFYSCGECGYYLHKICAELPREMNHPLHPQHVLTLTSTSLVGRAFFWCRICREVGRQFYYRCYTCNGLFTIDLTCASASYAIEDKCHQHPLTPIQHLTIPLPYCHICRTQEKGYSYKCNICPFWVHQNCTISIPTMVKHKDHNHPLTLLHSVPLEFAHIVRKCDICYDPLSSFCVYCCKPCMFSAHVNCARSEESERDQNIDGQCVALPSVQQKLTNLVSFAENYSDRDVVTNLLLGFDESHIDQGTNVKKEIIFFDHKHPLLLIDDQVNDAICDSCNLPLSTPSYGCIDCGYFLHKCCTELPKKILHPSHPQHQINLTPRWLFSVCHCCYQRNNGFVYECFECRDFSIDINCASLLRLVKHEAHKHPLIPAFLSSGSMCTACETKGNWILKCNTCSFILCFRCAMSPPIMKHRYDEHPFILTHSPPENNYKEYICDLCEKDLNPKLWYYHCRLCDQFTHIYCMRMRGADSNIKYGKSYKFVGHEHKLNLVSSTFDCSLCNECRFTMDTGYSVGLKCTTCKFKIHLLCALGCPSDLPN